VSFDRPASEAPNAWRVSWGDIHAARVRIRVPEGQILRAAGDGAFGFDGGRWVVARPGVRSVTFETGAVPVVRGRR